MCSLGFAKSLGFALIPLAICCFVANVLLFFPDGEVSFARDDHLSTYMWSFMGIGGGGIAIIISALTFLSMGKCADSYGTESCAMCGSVIASLIGLAGSGYCFIISALAMIEGPRCLRKSNWTMPFQENGPQYESTIVYILYTLSFLLKCISGLTVAKHFPVPLILRYLFDRDSWSMCEQPAHIVEWNVTLLSILLGLSLIEFLICFVQFISGLVSAVCRPCCYKQQYSLGA